MADGNANADLGRKIDSLANQVNPLAQMAQAFQNGKGAQKEDGVAEFGRKIDALAGKVEVLQNRLVGLTGRPTDPKKEAGDEGKEKKDLGKEILKGIGEVGVGAVKTAALPVTAGIAAWDLNEEKIVQRTSALMGKMESVTAQLDQLSPKINEAKTAFESLDLQEIANQVNATAAALKPLNLPHTAPQVKARMDELLLISGQIAYRTAEIMQAIETTKETLTRFPGQLKEDVKSGQIVIDATETAVRAGETAVSLPGRIQSKVTESLMSEMGKNLPPAAKMFLPAPLQEALDRGAKPRSQTGSSTGQPKKSRPAGATAPAKETKQSDASSGALEKAAQAAERTEQAVRRMAQSVDQMAQRINQRFANIEQRLDDMTRQMNEVGAAEVR